MSEPADPNRATVAAYEVAASLYAEQAPKPVSPAMTQFLDAITHLLPTGATVLELGSGPGREADELQARGLRVRRTDGAAAFVEMMQAQGQHAEVLNLLTDDFAGPYDLIFASAVFLHLSRAQLATVLVKAADAVNPGGVLAFTVKEGDGAEWTTARLCQPRHFTYWREPELRAVLAGSPWQLVSLAHVQGPQFAWLYVIARR